jgi:hypothetical protein
VYIVVLFYALPLLMLFFSGAFASSGTPAADLRPHPEIEVERPADRSHLSFEAEEAGNV